MVGKEREGGKEGGDARLGGEGCEEGLGLGEGHVVAHVVEGFAGGEDG